tara:strand:+ start:30 stop:542 length:513 start_codon:yes stop_codon:yes gene_type:complete
VLSSQVINPYRFASAGGLVWDPAQLTNCTLSDSDKTATGDRSGVNWGDGTITTTAETDIYFKIIAGYTMCVWNNNSTHSGLTYGTTIGYYFQGSGGSYAIESWGNSHAIDTATTWTATDVFHMSLTDTSGTKLYKNDVLIDTNEVTALSEPRYAVCALKGNGVYAQITLV